MPRLAKKSEKPPRIRRTAEDARTAILDATERRLVQSGPTGIRLQDVAEDVGIAHPTILHHFGSRERLIEAVTLRRLDALRAEVLAAFARTEQGEAELAALFERLFAVFGPGGHARVVAFRALEGLPGAQPESIEALGVAAHATRLARRTGKGPEPTLEDSYFTVLLCAFALFGEAIAGPLFRGEAEASPDRETSARFRKWLAKLVHQHMDC